MVMIFGCIVVARSIINRMRITRSTSLPIEANLLVTKLQARRHWKFISFAVVLGLWIAKATIPASRVARAMKRASFFLTALLPLPPPLPPLLNRCFLPFFLLLF
jgi:hypothetical protein